jgi:hypothetical protein
VIAIAGAATIATSPPSTQAEQSFPLSVTLTGDAPVAVHDLTVVLDRDVSGVDGRLEANFSEFDPRVRMAAVHLGTDGLPGYLHEFTGEAGNSIRGEIASFSYRACPGTERCVQHIRLIIELDDPQPADSITLEGELLARLHAPGSNAPIHGLVSIDGLDGWVAQRAPVVTSASTDFSELTLDSEHPMAIEQVTVTLGRGEQADDLTPVVAAARLHLQPVGDANQAQLGALVRTADGAQIGIGRVDVAAPSQNDLHAFDDCADEPLCEISLLIIFTWRGDQDQVARFRWALEPFVASYGEAAPTADREVSVSPVRTWLVPHGAETLTTSATGQLSWPGATRANYDNVSVSVRLTEDATDPGAGAPAIPGYFVLRITAVERHAPQVSQEPLRLIARGGSMSPVVELGAADTVGSAVEWPLGLEGKHRPPCAIGEECVLGRRIGLGTNNPGKNLAAAVTITWELQVFVTRFDDEPFPPGAGVSVTVGEQ